MWSKAQKLQQPCFPLYIARVVNGAMLSSGGAAGGVPNSVHVLSSSCSASPAAFLSLSFVKYSDIIISFSFSLN